MGLLVRFTGSMSYNGGVNIMGGGVGLQTLCQSR